MSGAVVMRMSRGAADPGATMSAKKDWSRRPGFALWATLSLSVVAALIASGLGAMPLHLADIAAPIDHLWQEGTPNLTGSAHVLWQIRLPRIVFALLVGAALAMSGTLSQALFRNPLADAGLLGITGGAACATALFIVLFSGLASAPLPIAWRPYALPGVAFVGALSVCLALERLARWLAPGSIAVLLLTGIAINAVATAVIGFATYVATDEQLRSLSFWTLGSVAGANWLTVMVLCVILFMAVVLVRPLLQQLNALALGESVAAHVGVDVQRLRLKTIVLIALVGGVTVAWCGLIGFLGLVAPHLARSWIGPDQRRLLPVAMALGGWLLLGADTFARTLAMPAEIPVGVFTAFIGGPVFVVMLRQTARHEGVGA